MLRLLRKRVRAGLMSAVGRPSKSEPYFNLKIKNAFKAQNYKKALTLHGKA
ncbi:hypothetical protein [Flexibacterium corallicola]|uniref:hypothetical protein n=1 Tax=Flexibacterium corallicola TaxID=3037259 RepID=UPI00286F9B57|nr:hypothetical protein [Pseudovibrio sp. M1P-2-3]